MAASDLTTIANVKGWLPQDASITGDDAVLARLITAASTFLLSYLQSNILSATYTERRNGNNQPSLMLYNQPITSVLSVGVDRLAIPAAPMTIQDYSWAPGFVFDNQLVYLRNARFNLGVQNVVITYIAGYATVPPDVEQACIELVTLRYRERGREGQASKNIGDGQVVSFSIKDMAPSTQTALNAYKQAMGIW